MEEQANNQERVRLERRKRITINLEIQGRFLSVILILLIAIPTAFCQQKKPIQRNRYGTKLIPQQDGSFTVGNRIMQLLDGARPEGFFEIEKLMTYWDGGKKPESRLYFHRRKRGVPRKYSPIYRIPKKRQVAVQLFQGTCDGTVHHSQALDFEKALKKAGQKFVKAHIYD